MKTLTVYHVSYLLTAHSSVRGGKAIHYGFFYLHMTKIHNNIHIFAPVIAGFTSRSTKATTVGILLRMPVLPINLLKNDKS